MSNRLDARAVKPESKRALKPKVRFPRFRNADGWKYEILGPHLKDCSTRVQSNTDLPVYSSTREGLKRQDTYFDGRVLLNENEYGVVPNGCIVYRHMSDDGIFKFNLNETGGNIAVSKEYPVFRTRNLNSLFLLYKLNESPDFEQFALSQKAGGTRTRLYFHKLCEWVTALPSLPEQQKIAECLSSLDALIAVHDRKLDALKAHKKGLMQQLFPSEGEIIPRLRFSKFRKAKVWSQRKVSEVLSKVSIPITVDNQTLYQEIGIRSHGKGIFHKEPTSGAALGDKRVFRVVKDALILNIVFAWEQAVATTSTEEIGMIASHRFPMYVPKSETCDVRFVKNAFLTPQGKHLLGVASPGGAGRNRTLGQEQFENLSITLPGRKEQTTIADTICTAEDLIASQAAKVETLKRHRKSLMQQLFPFVEDVEA